MDTDDYINNTDHSGRLERRGETVRRKTAGPWTNSGWGHGRDLSGAECAYAEHDSAEIPECLVWRYRYEVGCRE